MKVDAALGAEEMVVILGEQKLTLEEKVAKLQEEVSELEALQDTNDQLMESNAELEADLREELDMAQGAIREVCIFFRKYLSLQVNEIFLGATRSRCRFRNNCRPRTNYWQISGFSTAIARAVT